ncbi:MAG: hypothetical protein HY908_26735 [Myxococcales bacterium]|nr:hypothetical protein [Myxococcales bacterium]
MKWLVLTALVACSKGHHGKDECRAEADAVGALLVEAAKEVPSFYEPPADVKLVVRSDLLRRRDLKPGPVITITPSELRVAELWLGHKQLRARTLRTLDELGVALREVRAIAPAESASDPARIFFAIEPTTPWERVVASVDAARAAGFTAPGFVFEQPSALTPPPRSGIDAKLDALMSEEPATRAAKLAELTEEVVGPCDSLARSFRALARPVEEGVDKGMVIAMDIAPSLVACDCHVNIPELRAVMFRILHVERPVRIVTFDPAKTAERISFPPTTTWADASKRLAPVIENATLTTD